MNRRRRILRRIYEIGDKTGELCQRLMAFVFRPSYRRKWQSLYERLMEFVFRFVESPKWNEAYLLFTEFAFRLARTRKWKSLLASLPAILAAGTVLVILLLGRQTPKIQWTWVYHQAAAEVIKQGDFAAAEVYFRRMAAIDESAPAAFYGLALIAAHQGNVDRARVLMRRIAPEDEAGYAPAHLWLAKDMLKPATPLTPPAAAIMEHHLKQAAHGGNTEANLLLGQFYALRADAKRAAGQVDAAREDAKRAIPCFEQAVHTLPELRLTLAVLYAADNNTTASREEAAKARDFFRQKVETVPETPLEYRVQWARSEMVLANFPEAVRILQAGLVSSEPKRFHEALAAAYFTWYQAVPETEEGSLAKRLDLLILALTHGPGNPHVLTQLADLSTREWDRAGEASAALQKALAQGTAPAGVHAILGTRALQKGNLEQARLHLELAYQSNPQIPLVLNNLAWALTNRAKPDLPRALQLAEAARRLTNDPEISDTIGTILARLGRDRQAVTELETALRAFPNRAPLHAKLAELYEKLGDAELGKLHRGLAGAAKPR